MKPLKGKPIEPRPIIRALNRVQNNQTYEAEFVTLAPRGPGDTRAPGPDNGVLIDLEPTRNGPPFLLVGADITAVTDNVTRGTLDLRLLNNDLGGYGSELRSDLRIGFLTEASTEYYRLLRENGLFVQPQIGLLRQPVYIFRDQHRIAERLQQNAGGGLDFGRTYHSRAQLAAEWRYEQVRWHTQSGIDSRPDLSGTAQSGCDALYLQQPERWPACDARCALRYLGRRALSLARQPERAGGAPERDSLNRISPGRTSSD